MNSLHDQWVFQTENQLLALCLERQGKYVEARTFLDQKNIQHEPSPGDIIFTGQIMAKAGDWQSAVKNWMELVHKKEGDRKNRRLCADCLLRAAVHFSAEQDWHQALVCLGAAQQLFPDNPLLEHLPEDLEGAKGILFFNIGDYKSAIEEWRKNLETDGYKAHIIHLMAIGCHAMLNLKQDISLKQRLELITLAYICWVSLASEQSYWHKFYQNRQDVFSETITEDDFIKKISSVGSSRCETMLNELQTRVEQNDRESNAQIEAKRLEMQIERLSSIQIGKLSNLKKKFPPGGFQMAQLIIGEEESRSLLQQETQNAVMGSDGWFLAGLANPELRQSFIYYLNDEYRACIELLSKADGSVQQALLGLAVEQQIKILLDATHVGDCRYLAQMIPRIGIDSIYKRVIKLFEEMVLKRCKDFIGTRDRQEAVTFLEDILRLVKGDTKIKRASFARIEELLGSTLLQRSESRYDDGDMDGFIDDYKKASSLIKDAKVLEHHLKKIVKYHINKLFKDKKFEEILSFLKKLKAKLGDIPFLKAQTSFIMALRELEKSNASIADSKVFNLLKEAYGHDPSDSEIAGIYSRSLSNRAVSEFNRKASYAARSAINIATPMLKEALEIDGSNDHARENLLGIVRQAMQAGLMTSIPSSVLKDLL